MELICFIFSDGKHYGVEVHAMVRFWWALSGLYSDWLHCVSRRESCMYTYIPYI